MKEGAPVRFLLLLLGGWIGLRAAILAFGGASEEAQKSVWARPAPVAAAMAETPFPATSARARPIEGDLPVAPAVTQRFVQSLQPTQRHPAFGQTNEAVAATPLPPREAIVASVLQIGSAPPPSAARWTATTEPPSVPASPSTRARRWSGSAWALARRPGDATLAPGGTLGGSQAGARLIYRLNEDAARPLSLAARAYAPLRSLRGSEAALGLDWGPSAHLPVHLLVERRQRLGRDGRSAFSATIYGGGSATLAPHWRIEGYAQTGVVGARSRDLFVDGSARVVRGIGPVEAGAVVWGAAQPGASRVDVGPQLALPFRASGASLRLSAEYRFRIAGSARPASGPTLTLGVDF